MSNLGIVVLDGDVPPQNAVIEAIRDAALGNGISKVYGINSGMESLLRLGNLDYDKIAKDLTDRTISTADFQCVLSTSTSRWREIFGGEPLGPEVAAKRIAETLKNIGTGIDYLVILSGIRGIMDFKEVANYLPCPLDKNFAFIAKSMNCDVGRKNPNPNLPYDPLLNLGYPTAATVAKYKASLADKGAHNQHRIIVFELLGGLVGFAGAATQSSAADFVVLPEMFRKNKVEDIINSLVDEAYRLHSGMGAVLISVTEAVPTNEEERQKLLAAYDDLAKYKEVPLKGKNDAYVKVIKSKFKEGNYRSIKVTPAEVTYDCRWAFPTELDRFLARLYGWKAVQNLFSGKTRTIPFLTFNRITATDIKDLMKDAINNEVAPQVITLDKIESMSVDECVLQTIPPHYLENKKGPFRISELFEKELLYRLTKTNMPCYFSRPS